MKLSNEWSIIEKISFLQRKILITEILKSQNKVVNLSEEDYTDICKTLTRLQDDKAANQSQYWYVFFDFRNDPGPHLRMRLSQHDREYLYHLAEKFAPPVIHPKSEKPQVVKRKGGALF